MLRRSMGLVALALATPCAAQDEDRPSVAVSYVTDLIADVRGGVSRGADWLGRGDLTIDLPAASTGLPGSIFVDVIAIQDGAFSARRSGDGQIVSNVEAPAAIRPYEAWFATPLGKGASAKIGLIDLNAEFDRQQVGAVFLNSSFGVGPDFSQSGENGPSIFPAPAPAVMVKAEREGWSARLGVFATSPDADGHRVLPAFGRVSGALVVAEGDYAIASDREVQLGLWTYTSRTDALVGAGRSRQQGGYVQVEGRLPGTRRSDGIDGWLRLGVADRRVLPIAGYVGGGLLLTRDRDRLGIAVAHARLGISGIGQRRAETAIEGTWAHRATDWLVVQPDVQYVIHPGWTVGRPAALVAALRLSFAASLKR